jgi:TMEM175 potassium channel family protein
MDSRRAEAFSDGVFAVAITVLVFDLLSIGKGVLTAGVLLRAWPSYFAYVVSFLTIGIMWMNHHTILAHVNRVDRPLLVLNLLLLMGIVAIPFPTALVADHLRDSGGTVATVTYGLVMIAISAGFNSVWVYVVTHAPSLGAVVPRGALRQSIPGFTLGGAAYVAGTLIAAFWSPVAGLIIFGLLAVYYLFEHLPSPAEEAAPEESAAGEPDTD